MQILFAWDTHGGEDLAMAHTLAADGSDEAETREAALELAQAAWREHAAFDQWISRLAPKFALQRQPAVDRSLLRLAAWELTSGATPHRVVIDEAVEMAKQFSTAESARFINAVLDAMRKEHKSLTEGSPAPATPAAPAAPAAQADEPAAEAPSPEAGTAEGKGE